MSYKNNRTGKTFAGSTLLLLSCIISLLAIAGNLQAMIDAQWQIIDFEEHGTRRLVVIDDNRWFFYRPEPESELTLEIPEGKVMIKAAVRKDVNELTYQVRLGNVFRNFTTEKEKTTGDFAVMEDVFLNLGPGVHNVSISTPERLAYFKVFREEEVWTVPTERKAITPERYKNEFTLKSDTSESPYFSAANNNPLEFVSLGPNEVLGFARFFINDDDHTGEFDIIMDNRVIETVTIPPRKTGAYWLAENPQQDLSIGRRIEFEVPAGHNKIRIVPQTDDKFIFRFIMDVPKEVPEEDKPVYGLNAFEEMTFLQRAMPGLQLTFGTSFSYESNVFSLSERDRDRFDAGDDRFDFIETADDLVTNPSLRARYPFTVGDFTIEPYLNANYYHYLNNPDKSNLSILTGLFNSYKDFNLNFYYGYYGGTYVRDYFIRDEHDNIIADESFEYDRNLYRIYSYFDLTGSDTPLFYYQIEEYYHNKHFTGYDGTANTFGLGWRRSFPGFFLRFFYYYRDFEGDNITPDNDPSYESNIYDFQFRNHRVTLYDDYQFRPYIGFRFEDRYFQRAYSTPDDIDRFDYQSSRNDRRYRFNFGCEFYLFDNFDIILDYTYFLRDSTSENPNVARDKDYNEQTLSLGFEYTFQF